MNKDIYITQYKDTMNVMITGASKGIGKALCLLLAEKGANIAICARGVESLDALKTELESINSSGKFYTYQADVSQKEEVESFGQYALAQLGTIDILINNAGVFFPGNVHDEEDGALEQMIETNLYSAYHLTRKIVPSMMEKKDGQIINICSVASITALPKGGSYSISKYALMGFNKVLREEMKEHGIRVTAILPGATWSNSWAGAELPEERLMQATDIAKTIWNTIELGKTAVVEEVIIRPQLGDL